MICHSSYFSIFLCIIKCRLVYTIQYTHPKSGHLTTFPPPHDHSSLLPFSVDRQEPARNIIKFQIMTIDGFIILWFLLNWRHILPSFQFQNYKMYLKCKFLRNLYQYPFIYLRSLIIKFAFQTGKLQANKRTIIISTHSNKSFAFY